MRIDGLARMSGGPAAARAGAASGTFQLADAGLTGPTRSALSPRAAPGLDALLALQAIQPETPREKRRRAVSRGRGLLDALDGMKLALLGGRDDPMALASLAARLREARDDTGDVGLEDALSAIELRAAVEIAKRGA